MNWPSLSLNTSKIQARVNEVHKLETSDFYGSLFEFIDRDDPNKEEEDLDKKVRQVRKRADQDSRREQNRFDSLPPVNQNIYQKSALLDQSIIPSRPQSGKKTITFKDQNLVQRKQSANSKQSRPGTGMSSGILKQIGSFNEIKPPSKQQDRDRKDSIKDTNKTDTLTIDKSNQERPGSASLNIQQIQSKRKQSQTYEKKIDLINWEPVKKEKKKAIESKVGKYIKGKGAKKQDSDNLLGMYHQERQQKASEKLKQELEVFEKLAMKGGQHILRIEKQMDAENTAQQKGDQNSYGKSFKRLKEGLRILRDKKTTLSFFDKEGHYKQLTEDIQKEGQKQDAKLGITGISFYSQEESELQHIPENPERQSAQNSVRISEEHEDHESQLSSSFEEDLSYFMQQQQQIQKNRKYTPGQRRPFLKGNSQTTSEIGEDDQKQPKKDSRQLKLLLVNRGQSRWLKHHTKDQHNMSYDDALQIHVKPEPLELGSSEMIKRAMLTNQIAKVNKRLVPDLATGLKNWARTQNYAIRQQFASQEKKVIKSKIDTGTFKRKKKKRRLLL